MKLFTLSCVDYLWSQGHRVRKSTFLFNVIFTAARATSKGHSPALVETNINMSEGFLWWKYGQMVLWVYSFIKVICFQFSLVSVSFQRESDHFSFFNCSKSSVCVSFHSF